MRGLVILALLAMGFFRTTVQPGIDLSDLFKDFSHLVVGALIGAAIALSCVVSFTKKEGFVPFPCFVEYKKFLGNSAFWITVFEVFCGIIGKHTGKSIYDLMFG